MTTEDTNEGMLDSEETPNAEAHDLSQDLAEWKELAIRRLAEVENIRRRTNLEKQELLLSLSLLRIRSRFVVLVWMFCGWMRLVS